MSMIILANNLQYFGVKVKILNNKDNLQLQSPPTLSYVGHYSGFTMKEYKHRPFGAYPRVITPTTPPQESITN